MKCRLVSLLLLVSVSTVCSAGDWPQFLGPNRNGISHETGLLQDWRAGEPKVIWRAEVGVGMSAPSIVDGRYVTLGQNRDGQFLLVGDTKTGEIKERVKVAAAYGNGMGDGPRATPAVVGGIAYAFTGEGILAAVDLKAAKIVWSVDTVKESGAKVADYGMASSPLVVGDAVVVTGGSARGTVAAFHRKTGERIWATGSDRAGYSSSALLDVGGKRQVVSFTGASVLGIDPESGKQLWRVPYVTDYDCNIMTPVAVAGGVFISAGENHGSTLLSVKQEGGTWSAQPVWTSTGSESVLRAEWQTPVLLDGNLYGFDNVGSAGPVSHLTCVNAKTGERLWQQRRFGKGNLVAADGRLWISTFKGELVLVKASPDGFAELGRVSALGSTRTAPVIANGFLYLRDNKEVVCFDIRRRK